MRMGNIALREKVQRLLEDASGDTADKLSTIISREGFRFSEFEPNEKTSGVLGAVFYETNEILINSARPESERLFTLAHELAHVMLHQEKDYMDFRAVRNKDAIQEKDPEESEANVFAYEFTLPYEDFIKAYRDFGADTFKIAEYLSVMQARVDSRLIFLKDQIKAGKIADFISANLKNDG